MRKLFLPWPIWAAFRKAPRWRPAPSLVRSGGQWTAAVLAAGIAVLAGQPETALAQAADPALTVSAGEPALPDPLFNKGAAVPIGGASAPPQARPATTAGQGRHAPPNTKATRPSAAAGERLVWDKAPLQITLGIGPDRERAVTFPAQMHIGIPSDIAHLLRVQTVGRTSYFTALAPFPRSRVVAEDRATGAVILLDLAASKDGSTSQPITVVVPQPPALAIPGNDDAQTPVDMVTLTRFAARQMYGPRRLATPHPAIRRVLVDGTPIQDLYVGAGVRATPAAQWRSEDFHLTAVVLQNLRPEAIELDPMQVRGHWRAITFHDGRLHARGSEADTTVVYLVCDRSFETCR